MLNRSTKMEEDIMDMWKASSETDSVDFSTKMADTTKVCGETTQWMAKEFFTTKTVELPMMANGTRANFMEKVKSTTITWRKWLITLIIGILTQTLITTGNIIKVIFYNMKANCLMTPKLDMARFSCPMESILRGLSVGIRCMVKESFIRSGTKAKL